MSKYNVLQHFLISRPLKAKYQFGHLCFLTALHGFHTTERKHVGWAVRGLSTCHCALEQSTSAPKMAYPLAPSNCL